MKLTQVIVETDPKDAYPLLKPNEIPVVHCKRYNYLAKIAKKYPKNGKENVIVMTLANYGRLKVYATNYEERKEYYDKLIALAVNNLHKENVKSISVLKVDGIGKMSATVVKMQE